MASIKALLKINENGNGVIESVTTNIETRNISTLPYTTDVKNWFLNQTSANKNYAGASFNVLGISNSATWGSMRYGVQQSRDSSYTNSYNGLVFGCPSQLQTPLTITIVGTDVLAFKIHFDTTDGQSPFTYTVYSSISGQTTTHSVSTLGILEVNGLLAGHGTTIITITSWQYQDEAIAIKYFENVEIDIPMDKYWIDSFETQTQKTSDGESIQYGLLANTGSITLNDKRDIEGKPILLEYSKMGYLGMYLFELDLFINNKIVQSHISNSAPYFTDNYTMQFQLTNDIEKFQNKYFSQTFPSGYNVFEILGAVFSDFDFDLDFKDMLMWTSNGNVDIDVGTYLSYFEIPSGQTLTLEGNVLEIANKICNAFGLNAYFDDGGKVLYFSSARPKMTIGEHIFNIPYQKQYSDFDYSILTVNRYDRVFFDDETSIVNYKNAVTLSKNEFFDLENTNIQTDTVEKTLRQSILEDYADGIKIARISVFPSDLYTINGELVKKWNNGQILEIDDNVRIENKEGNNVLYDKNYNEVYWRVIDRKVKYEGQILIDLVLQEIKN